MKKTIEIYNTHASSFFNVGGKEYHFKTHSEAAKMANKLKTAQAIIAAVQSLSLPTDNAENLRQEYFDVGAPTDAEIAPLGITAAQLAACITLLEQVDKLMTGANDGAGHSTISPATYVATLNAVRRI